MQYSILGSTGIKVSRLAFGTLALGRHQANLSLSQGSRLLRQALYAGINFFDTAEAYDTYAYLAKAFTGVREQAVICSRSYAYDYASMRASLKQCLQALGTDYVDIFMLHEQESELTLAGHAEALRCLKDAKAAGIIRAIGLSTHYIRGARAAQEHPDIEIIFALLNCRGLGIQDGGVEEMMQVLQAAHQGGKGIFVMKALGGGHLFKTAEHALGWARDLPWVHSVAVGMQNGAELNYNCALFCGHSPDTGSRNRLAQRQRSLKIEFCTGCGKCIAACPFNALYLDNGTVKVKAGQCMLCSYCAGACEGFCLKVG